MDPLAGDVDAAGSNRLKGQKLVMRAQIGKVGRRRPDPEDQLSRMLDQLEWAQRMANQIEKSHRDDLARSGGPDDLRAAVNE